MGLDRVFAHEHRAAISLLLKPSAISSRISSSRGVMPSDSSLS
jgi:hypothetical protein